MLVTLRVPQSRMFWASITVLVTGVALVAALTVLAAPRATVFHSQHLYFSYSGKTYDADPVWVGYPLGVAACALPCNSGWTNITFDTYGFSARVFHCCNPAGMVDEVSVKGGGMTYDLSEPGAWLANHTIALSPDGLVGVDFNAGNDFEPNATEAFLVQCFSHGLSPSCP